MSAAQTAERPLVEGMAPSTPPGARRQPQSRHGGAKPTRGARPGGQRALFLDFDGVLSPTTFEGEADIGDVVHTPLFGWLPVLVAVLRPHHDVSLVIHSTWRYSHDIDELRELLGALGARVVGATPQGPRYDAILWWLSLNPAFTDYRIIDDCAQEFPSPPPAELILCNPRTGVAGPEVLASLRAWLEQ